MKGQRAAVRYARSLMQLAKERSSLDELKQDIEVVIRAIENSEELNIFLKSPLVKMEKKIGILKSIFQGKVSELCLNFIVQIANHKREESLELICKEFIRQYNKMHNIATVELTTARPLNDDLRKEVLAFVKDKYEFSSVELKEVVDEELIGGLILRIEDRQIDGSIRRKLQDIRKELIQA